jgi:hypothetical protein
MKNWIGGIVLGAVLAVLGQAIADQVTLTVDSGSLVVSGVPASHASANGGIAAALDTAYHAAAGGLDVFTVHLNATNRGLALYPRSSGLPTNPSGNIGFSLTSLGDVWIGDVYCLTDAHTAEHLAPGAWGCVYGRRVGTPLGPTIFMSGRDFIPATTHAGASFTLWPDIANVDGSGNRGYLDMWAWGANDSGFSNTLNFGNRDSNNDPHRRLRILNDGSINLPDLAGSGTARLCIDAAGTLVRGGC